MPSLDDNSFAKLADDALVDLLDRIEDALGDRADVELQEGILTIDLDDGGQYVINKHVANHQIWLSSPFSGASHFEYHPEQGWISTRGGGMLHAVLEEELSKRARKSFTLQ